jgi:hypothetical protein
VTAVDGTARRRVRASLWRQVLGRYGPAVAAERYAALVLARAHAAEPQTLAVTAREDLARTAAALHAVLTVHTGDSRGRCAACSHGPHLVDTPCATRRAVEDALRTGWPPPPARPGGEPSDED